MSSGPGLFWTPGEDLAVHVVNLALIGDHDEGVEGVLALWVLLARDGEDAIHLVLLAGLLEDSNLGSIQRCGKVCPLVRMESLQDHFL